jgi:hypothetical protein
MSETPSVIDQYNPPTDEIPNLDHLIFDEYDNHRGEDALWDGIETDEMVAYIEEQRQLFIESDYTTNPDLRPKSINEEQAVLVEIRENLDTTIEKPALRQLYRGCIEEDLANISATEAAFANDHEAWQENNIALYGEPDKQIFRATCAWLVDEALRACNDPRPEVRAAAEHLIRTLGPSVGDRNYLVPSDTLFQSVRARETAEGGHIYRSMDGIDFPPDTIVTKDNGGDDALRQAQTNMRAEPNIIESPSWSVGRDGISRPSNYQYPYKKFRGYVIHEERHVDERIVAELAAGIGLVKRATPHSERGNEGTSGLEEQVDYETFDEFAKEWRWHEMMLRHIAVSASCGLVTGENMNFSDTYKLLQSATLVFEASHPDASNDFAEIEQLAHDEAWDIGQTVYANTDGTGKGGGWRRAMIYLEGNVDAWREEAKHPGIIDLSTLAKFDLSNKEVVECLIELGIIHPMYIKDFEHESDENYFKRTITTIGSASLTLAA